MKDGYRNECKACHARKAAERYRREPQLVKDRVKKWQQENADRLNDYRRERRQLEWVELREKDNHLRRKLGTTAARHDAMLRSQGGGCAICGDQPPKTTSLHVGHEHGSGRVRGLLCMRCNNALGLFEDDEDLLWSALTYLGADRRIRGLKAL